ncbi:NAD-dependent epimerase [Paenibacillus sp. D51F]
MRKILITGSSGFIGYHLCEKLLADGYEIVGIDNMNDYYDVQLKNDRKKRLLKSGAFYFYSDDLKEKDRLFEIFKDHKDISIIIHLGAQAGVRYSLINPQSYIDSNVTGFVNILEACRHFGTDHLLYASSSSVYGANVKMPFSVHDNVDHPVSLYAATKKSNELFAHTYSHLFGIPTTGLRFFTVYGPWGRPDMAYFSFTRAIFNREPIKVFNHGKMMRDFTYIDDIVMGINKLIDNPPQPKDNWDRQNPDPSSSYAPYKVFNIGNNTPVQLGHFIEVLEKRIGISAIKDYHPMQSGDVVATYADISALESETGFKPKVSIEEGLDRFVTWYESYYQKAATTNKK